MSPKLMLKRSALHSSMQGFVRFLETRCALGLCFLSALLQFSGCTSQNTSKYPAVPVANPQNIFVFFDGTANLPVSKTNVWKSYDAISKVADPANTTLLYIPGVGTEDHDFLGKTLGWLMEERITEGYRFIYENYSSGSKVYIFGFSRGAHQARALAGVLAYAGVPFRVSDREPNLNDIIDEVKELRDVNFETQRHSWKPGDPPLSSGHLGKYDKLTFSPVVVEFLGVWDTVPGSSLITYDYFSEVPETRKRKGDRYKTLSYAPIRCITHALSLDEKRSKFRPLYVKDPDNSSYTVIHQRWFPGAHSDVGGGYEDDDQLSHASYNWMMSQLSSYYSPAEIIPRLDENAKALAHYSIGDSPGNTGSRYEDRSAPPSDCTIDRDPSIQKRTDAGSVQIRLRGMSIPKEYPNGPL